MSSYLVKDNNYFTILCIMVLAACILIPPNPLLQTTHIVNEPNLPSMTNINYHAYPKHDDLPHLDNEPMNYEPFLVTIMPPPQTIVKDGTIMSLSIGSSHVSYLKTIHGVPLDVPSATSVISITKPQVNLDMKSYMWQDKIFLEITDPLDVKDPSKIETIGDGQNKIMVTIGSMVKLDCTLPETGKGTGFFSGIFIMKSPWIITSNHYPYYTKCTIVHQSPVFIPEDEHIIVSFEYGPNKFATASAPIIMGSFG